MLSSTRDVLKWPSESEGRVLVVGDIHGEYEMFKHLLKHADYDERKDFVYALGDLIDRGPDSRGVLDWFASGPRRRSLLGNHEAMMVDAASDPRAERVWIGNGGSWASELSHRDSHLYRCMVRTFPMTAEIQYGDGHRVGLVHADIPLGISWAQMEKIRLQSGDAIRDHLSTKAVIAIWGRLRIRAAQTVREDDLSAAITPSQKVATWQYLQPVKGVDLLVSGHTVVRDHVPFGIGNVMWIETGAAYDGRLTAIDPKSRLYWQVGQTPGEVWGPTPLPDPVPVSRSRRPTKEERALAAKDGYGLKAAFRKRRIRLPSQ